MAGFTTGIQLALGLNAAGFKAGLDAVKGRVTAFNAATKGSSERLKRDIGGAIDTITKKGGQFFTSMREGFNRVAKWGALAAVAIGGIFLKKLSGLASSAEETESMFRVVFKGVEEGADAAVERFRALGGGITQVRGLMASLQDTFVPFGFARDDALALSEAVTQLGFDLGSFKNRDPSETINLLTSALVGNHEAVRSFSIQITQATLDQELLRLGFKKSNAGASEQSKMLARLSLMFQSSKDAMGDLARTNDSFSNTWRRLKNRITEVLETAGADLNVWLLETIEEMGGTEVIAEKVRKVLNELRPTLRAIGDGFRDLFSSLSETRGEFNFVVKALQITSLAFNGLNTGIRMGVGALTLGQVGMEGLEDSILATRKALDRFNGTQSEYVTLIEGTGQKTKASTAIQSDYNQKIDDGSALIERMRDRLKGLESAAGGSRREIEKTAKKIEELGEQRAQTAKDFEQRGFDLGFDALATDAEKIAALQKRILDVRQGAEISKSFGDLEGARAELERMAALIEQLSDLEGGAFVGLRQTELQGLAQEIDRLFEQQAAAQTSAQQQVTAAMEETRSKAAEVTSELQKQENIAANIARLLREAAAFTSTHGQQPVTVGGARGGAASALGPATDPRDTIPALLRRGETVLTPEHTSRLSGILKRIGVPGFAQGGSVDFNNIAQSTRKFSDIGRALQVSDAREVSAYRAQQMKALIEQVGFKRASELMIQQQRAGIPIVPPGFESSASSFGLGARGFASGGRVEGGPTTNNFGGITIEYHTTGSNATDAVAMAGQIQRAVRRRMASTN